MSTAKRDDSRATDPLSRDWDQHAETLADWAYKTLVNREDAFGRYLPRNPLVDNANDVITDKSGLTLGILRRHFSARSRQELIGLHSTVRDVATGPGEIAACWSKWLAIDIDRHDDTADAEATERAAKLLAERAIALGFIILLLDSNGRGGFHLLIIFEAPVSTSRVYALGKWMVRDWSTLGLADEPEFFPRQPFIEEGKYGNWLRLPGRHHTHNHHTRVWDVVNGAWAEGSAAIDLILQVSGNPADLIPADALALPKPNRRPKRVLKPEDVGKDATLAREALRYLDPSMPYREWLNVGMALTQLGREGLNLWDAWSADSEKHQEGLCDRKWRTFRRDGIAMGTLFHMAKARGFEFPRKDTRLAVAKLNAVPARKDTRPQLGVVRPDDDSGDQPRGDGGNGGDLPPGQPPAPEPGGDSIYFGRGNAFYMTVELPKGPIEVLLSNFTAKITHEVSRDDGDDRTKWLKIQGTRFDGHRMSADVAAAKFNDLAWVMEQFGGRAIISAGPRYKDHLRAAIQTASHDMVCITTYTHTGWREVDGVQHYLTAGGAIGPDGINLEISIDLGVKLQNYSLPAPPVGKELNKAVRASLGLSRIYQEDRPGSKSIAAAMLAYTYRAVLGRPNHSCQINGNSGAFKSSTTLLSLQHFGNGWESDGGMPANWSSTANQLEVMLHTVKDCVIVIDDFVPEGSSRDAAQITSKAERIFRTQGNGSGRERLAPDGSFRPSRPPRGTVMSSGEDRVSRRSADARTLPIRFKGEKDAGDTTVDPIALAECQADGKAGLYAAAMAGYVKWLSPKIQDVQRAHKSSALSLRETYQSIGSHSRTPDIIADLVAGFAPFLEFAVEIGAITPADAEAYAVLVAEGLQEAVATSDDDDRPHTACEHYLRLVKTALLTNQAFLADSKTGMTPAGLGSECGWRKVLKSRGEVGSYEDWETVSGALKIGWTNGERVFLDSDAAYQAAMKVANAQGVSFATTKETVNMQLDEAGKLTEKDPRNLKEGRNRLTTRKSIEGRQRPVLVLMTEEFWSRPTTPEEEAAETAF